MERLGEKALPFYELIKKSDKKFDWIEEVDQAFAHLKRVLSTSVGHTQRKRAVTTIHCRHASGGKHNFSS
jgi:hypothetical protein